MVGMLAMLLVACDPTDESLSRSLPALRPWASVWFILREASPPGRQRPTWLLTPRSEALAMTVKVWACRQAGQHRAIDEVDALRHWRPGCRSPA
jgi:hypothetical protein